MRIARHFIDELITRVDIVELIDNYVSLRKSGHNYKALCPFHNEKTPSFSVNSDKQFYYCFGCGAHGNAIGFLIDYAHLNYIEAVHELASRTGMEVVYEQGSKDSAPTLVASDDLYPILTQAAQYYRQQLRQSQTAINYLKQRGLTGEIARDFGLGYAPPGWDNLLKILGTDPAKQRQLVKAGLTKEKEKQSGQYYDRFRDRIMFPIYDIRGRVIAFGGRKLGSSEREPKYLNSPETPLFQKSRELYGWYLAQKIRSLQKIVVVEGYMDVVALAQYGIANAVATLGTATTRQHLSRLFRRLPEIIFCFDGDEAGQKAAWRALEIALSLLQEGRQIRFVFLPEGYDPDTYIRQEGTTNFQAHLDNAMPLSNFLFETLMRQVDMQTIDGRARLVELAKPLLKRLPPGPYHELMVQKLSELSGILMDRLATLIQTEAPKLQPQVIRQFQPIANSQTLFSVHRAIVCLLHKPILSQSVEYPNQKLAFFHQIEIKLLLNIIELTRKNPQLRLGAICEHWRETEYEPILNHLATQNTHLTDNSFDLDKEFLDAINRLYEDYANQRLVFLMEKITELTFEEKQELKSLSQYRGQNPH
jgi:DNA primase